jgi:hypothetical protein
MYLGMWDEQKKVKETAKKTLHYLEKLARTTAHIHAVRTKVMHALGWTTAILTLDMPEP